MNIGRALRAREEVVDALFMSVNARLSDRTDCVLRLLPSGVQEWVDTNCMLSVRIKKGPEVVILVPIEVRGLVRWMVVAQGDKTLDWLMAKEIARAWLISNAKGQKPPSDQILDSLLKNWGIPLNFVDAVLAARSDRLRSKVTPKEADRPER